MHKRCIYPSMWLPQLRQMFLECFQFPLGFLQAKIPSEKNIVGSTLVPGWNSPCSDEIFLSKTLGIVWSNYKIMARLRIPSLDPLGHERLQWKIISPSWRSIFPLGFHTAAIHQIKAHSVGQSPTNFPIKAWYFMYCVIQHTHTYQIS